jgi:leucyl aminopeptidase
MQVTVGSTRPSNLSTDVAVFGWYGRGGRRSAAFNSLNQAIGGGLDSLLKLQGWGGKPGEVISFPAPTGLRARLVVVGSLGPRGDSGPRRVRELAAKAGSAARRAKLQRMAFWLDPSMDRRDELDRPTVQAVGEGVVDGAYRFDARLGKKAEGSIPDSIFFYFEGRKERPLIAASVERGAIIGTAQGRARDLVNEPPNHINPVSLVEYAAAMCGEKGIEVTVLDKAACEERKMGAFLAVATGSDYPPALVHMIWRPKNPRRRIVLVGKALTFDSGGLCLKPAGSQLTMKMDMGGSAAVIGTMAAIADLEVDSEVHGIFASCENMTGASAYRTGDVLTASNGKTIEVGNTDAEGRLTLADALVYACEQEPDLLIDLATLTGAAVVALGPEIAALMGTGRGLIRDLKAAAERSGEPMWELPFPMEYKELLKSQCADLSNIGGRWGGAITAGLFLSEFVSEGVQWAHIDIAGPAFLDKPLRGRPYGGTGFGVRALTELIAFS